MVYGTPYSGGYVSDQSADVRATFIRQVYTLFFVSVLVTIGVGALCAQAAIAPVLLGMWPILAIAGFACIIGLHFARRVSGLNVALLYLFAAIQGAILGPVLTLVEQHAPGVPAEAAWLSGAVFGGLSLYVFQSKKDFSYLGGMLFMGLIALIVAGIVGFFVHAALFHTIYCVIGVLIFSGYVLYDTSQIMNHLRTDEAVTGAIELYLDLLNLFWFILRLLSDRR